MKRVYKIVSVDSGEAGGHVVKLDGRLLKSPAKNPLEIPTRGLAAAVAAEWDAQTDEIRPAAMPLMQLVSTAVDRVRIERDGIVTGTAAYAGTDLLCYRADSPRALVERQAVTWQPLLDWAALRYDAALTVHTGVMPVSQPEGALNALRAAVEAYDHWGLSALQLATDVCGSLVIALALLERRIDAAAAFAAAQLDETYAIEKWGEDSEATLRRANMRADIEAVRRYYDLLYPPAGA